MCQPLTIWPCICCASIRRKLPSLMPAWLACYAPILRPVKLYHAETRQLLKVSCVENVVAGNQDAQQTQRALHELVTLLNKLGEYDAAIAACYQANAMFRQYPEVQRIDSQDIFRSIGPKQSQLTHQSTS